MEARGYSETSVTVYQCTRRHIARNPNFHRHHWEPLGCRLTAVTYGARFFNLRMPLKQIKWFSPNRFEVVPHVRLCCRRVEARSCLRQKRKRKISFFYCVLDEHVL